MCIRDRPIAFWLETLLGYRPDPWDGVESSLLHKARTQPKLTFRFSRFRTFFSTIVRHCFSVVSLASEAISPSCAAQSDGILSAKISTMCCPISAPGQPDVDDTVSFTVIVPPVVCVPSTCQRSEVKQTRGLDGCSVKCYRRENARCRTLAVAVPWRIHFSMASPLLQISVNIDLMPLMLKRLAIDDSSRISSICFHTRK